MYGICHGAKQCSAHVPEQSHQRIPASRLRNCACKSNCATAQCALRNVRRYWSTGTSSWDGSSATLPSSRARIWPKRWSSSVSSSGAGSPSVSSRVKSTASTWRCDISVAILSGGRMIAPRLTLTPVAIEPVSPPTSFSRRSASFIARATSSSHGSGAFLSPSPYHPARNCSIHCLTLRPFLYRLAHSQ